MDMKIHTKTSGSASVSAIFPMTCTRPSLNMVVRRSFRKLKSTSDDTEIEDFTESRERKSQTVQQEAIEIS